MSSSPNAGAMWTMPVPSSVVTKSAATTRCAPAMYGNGRLVLAPDELGAGESRSGAGVLAEHPRHQRLGEDQALVAVLDARVGDLGVDRDRLVGRQRPRRGGPDQQRLVRTSTSGKRT